MRVAQIILAGASLYELKSQRIDAVLPGVECVNNASGFDLAHVYGPSPLPRLRIGAPYVANARMPQHWWQPQIAQPRAVITPFDIPEAVEETFFAASSEAETGIRNPRPDSRDPRSEHPESGTHHSEGVKKSASTGNYAEPTHASYLMPHSDSARRTQHSALSTPYSVGVFLRPSVQNIVEQTMHRLQRTREDITWSLFETPPGPREMESVDVWVDPAVDGDDYDGLTAEALVTGRVVVASRTAINLQRTEKGRTALLVPPGDSNELTHAILTALFKPEAGQQRATAARQTISKFRPRQRHRALTALYETLLP